jgi:predicted transcriptional regulator
VPLRVPTPEDLKAFRQQLGLTQSELARVAGVSQPLIARIENNTVDPRLSTLRAIVSALNRAEREEVRLRDVMNTPVEFVRATDSVGDAIRLMRDRGFSQVPVLAKGVPVGSLSERALVHALAGARDAREVAKSSVRDVMGAPFPTTTPDTTVEGAYRALEDQPALLVMDRGQLVGIVAKSDLLNMIK